MNSPKSFKSSPIAVPKISDPSRQIRAHSDPNIFKNDRVLRTLISREMKHASGAGERSTVQTEVKPGMRLEVANWMLEVCEEEESSPQVFCLAINFMDRFLATTNIRSRQLQLLGCVCLLVAWKVREHTVISAQKLIELTDYSVTLEDLLEWEFLLLSKLDWDLDSVIGPDYVEHILQRLLRLTFAWNIDATRRNAETLIYLCYTHQGLACYPPSLIAVSSILTTLRPVLEGVVARDTPSPSSASSASPTPSLSSPTQANTSKKISVEGSFEHVIEAVERLTLVERSLVLECMEKLEILMQASLPPSPTPSEGEGPVPPPHSDYPHLVLQSLFPETESGENEHLKPILSSLMSRSELS